MTNAAARGQSPIWPLCSKASLVLALTLLPCILFAQVPKIADIPENLPAQQRHKLMQTKESLVARRNELVKKASDHNAKCGAVPEGTPAWQSCNEAQSELETERHQYIDAVNRFNREVEQAISAQDTLLDSTPGTKIGAAGVCRGEVFMVTPDGRRVRIQSGTPIPLKAHVTTGPDGHFQILLLDETVFTIGPDGDMVLDEFVYDPNTSVGKITAQLIKGLFRFVTGKVARTKPENMKVKLAAGAICFRGTDVETMVSPDGSGYVKLFFGQVEITEKKNGALLLLNPGQMVTFTADGTFSPPMPMPPGTSQ